MNRRHLRWQIPIVVFLIGIGIGAGLITWLWPADKNTAVTEPREGTVIFVSQDGRRVALADQPGGTGQSYDTGSLWWRAEGQGSWSYSTEVPQCVQVNQRVRLGVINVKVEEPSEVPDGLVVFWLECLSETEQ